MRASERASAKIERWMGKTTEKVTPYFFDPFFLNTIGLGYSLPSPFKKYDALIIVWLIECDWVIEPVNGDRDSKMNEKLIWAQIMNERASETNEREEII